MKRIRPALSVAAHPIKSLYGLRAEQSPSRSWKSYEAACVAQGLKRGSFILSMDCDTEEDIACVVDVHERLQSLGIMPVYAVPGELLIKGRAEYLEIHKSGASFINHGYRQHTIYNKTTGSYQSFFFYDQQPADLVARDIKNGHDVLGDFLSASPKGFRTPHFGSFQKKRNLNWLHEKLSDLGYRYSTSTMPFYALRNGPVTGKRLAELPVTGCADNPMRILDSWSFRFDPSSGLTTDDYEAQVKKLGQMLDEGRVISLNLYVDPSQIQGWDGFFTAVKRLSSFSLPSYDHLLDMAGR